MVNALLEIRTEGRERIAGCLVKTAQWFLEERGAVVRDEEELAGRVEIGGLGEGVSLRKAGTVVMNNRFIYRTKSNLVFLKLISNSCLQSCTV